ncbi:MAG: class I SAM-dependent methyltransferase [Actinomycetaceae bacterium]|nr:class I SAM-dependent methyltransferase [Actinomycetaceae bacterium]
MSINPFTEIVNSFTYVDVRPGYPSSLVRTLIDDAGARNDAGGHSTSPLTTADIGAGTGKLTQTLVTQASEWQSGSANRSAQVYAIEPSTRMRAGFAQALPDFPASHLLATTAENTGLPDASCDLVTYAQAWHWLDPEATSVEAARIIRPGGLIAILFNQMDVSVPWVKRLTRIMRSGDVHRAHQPPQLGPEFTEPVLTQTSYIQHLTPAQVLELGTTRSSWIRSTPENRARMRANLEWYVFEQLGYRPENFVEIPYLVYCWIARRR